MHHEYSNTFANEETSTVSLSFVCFPQILKSELSWEKHSSEHKVFKK